MKQIFYRADFILSNYQIQPLLNGNICVPDMDFTATVSSSGNHSLSCSCVYYLRAKSICSHTVAVAEDGSYLISFLKHIEKSQDVNKILNQNPKSGQKPKEKKKRKGKNNTFQQPIQEEVSTNDLDFPIVSNFTEYYHNEESFEIRHITSAECKRAKACITCKVGFPTKTLAVPEKQIVIIHKKRYERPLFGDKKKFLRMTVTNQLGKKILLC